MNFKLLARVLGLLLMMESLALLACTLFAVYESGWEHSSSTALGAGTGFALLLGLILVFVGRGKYDRIPRREGVLIVGVGWMASGLIGAIPFMLAEPGLSFSGAFFESISGFTTTGSTVIADLNEWPKGILLWRSVSQWLGGLGILVLFVALLSSLGTGTKSLFRNESSFEAAEVSNAKIKDTALLLWRLYLVLTVCCLLGMKALGMTWFDAFAHAMTTVSTGGFSTHNESLGFFSHWESGFAIELWTVLFMLLGSVSFLIYVVVLNRNWKRLRNEEEAKWYLILLFVATALIVAGLSLSGHSDVGESLRGALFTVISIASSTGFGTVDYEKWPVGAHFILLGLMLVGGCAGSTAGGAKVSRVLLLARSALQEIVQAFRPHQIFRLQVNGNSITDQSRSQTILFIALFLFIAFGSMLFVALLESGHGIDFETAVASVLATLSNIGPGVGEVGPTDNFGHFRQPTLIYLALLMVLGRLEIFAFLVLFVPAAWKKY